MTQSYSSYDAMNRLGAFGEGTVSQTFNHDRYGNHWVASSSGYQLNSLTPTGAAAFNTANNRLVAQSYDGRGNQVSMSPYTMAYDGDDHLKSVASANESASYQYDSDGQRVVKMTCSNPTPCTGSSTSLATTAFVYDAMGELAAEYSTQPASGGTEYYTADHLGSTRMVTDTGGSVKRRYDYLPYGEELFAGTNGRSSLYPAAPPSTPAQGGMLFTGQLRDSETGLDFFEARYFSGPQARFTSPDGPFNDQDPSDPQSWSLYNCVRNNPLNGTDPDGTCATPDGTTVPCPSGGSTTVTGTPDPIPFTGGDPSLNRVLYGILNGVTSTLVQQQQFTQAAINWIQRVNLNCVSSAAINAINVGGTAAVAGAAVGAVAGLGVGDAVTIPTGAVVTSGAAAGAALANGLMNCKNSSGGGGGGKPRLVSNPKHHANSESPQPKNVEELFEESIPAKHGTRWTKDANGIIHRFSAPSNGESHWNGSTGGTDPIPWDRIPPEIRNALR